MYTSADKAWATFLSSGAFLAGHYLGFTELVGIPDMAWGAMGTVVATAATWLVPNKSE